MRTNDCYRTYDLGTIVALHCPSGQIYELDPHDCDTAFKSFTPKMVTDKKFYFTDPFEAARFEEKVERLSQEYFYNVKRSFF